MYGIAEAEEADMASSLVQLLPFYLLDDNIIMLMFILVVVVVRYYQQLHLQSQ